MDVLAVGITRDSDFVPLSSAGSMKFSLRYKTYVDKGLASGHAVNTLHIQATAVDLIHAFLDNDRHRQMWPGCEVLFQGNTKAHRPFAERLQPMGMCYPKGKGYLRNQAPRFECVR